MFLEKFGTGGAVLAALACPICFPKLALIGAAVGLGAFTPFERYTAFAVQALFLLAFVGQVWAYRRHGNRWLLGFSGLVTATLVVGYYVVRSSLLLEIALVGLVVASVWHAVEARRCAKCAPEAKGTEVRRETVLRAGRTPEA
jgi:mercuric ion transport protein